MSLKNQLERDLHVPIRVRAGAPGSLRVLVDGQAVYSKQKNTPPPHAAQILEAIRDKIGQKS